MTPGAVGRIDPSTTYNPRAPKRSPLGITPALLESRPMRHVPLTCAEKSVTSFAATEAERRQAGDPRPSLAERYPSHEAWARKLTDAVHALRADRLLLAEDADRLIAAARDSWEVHQAL